MSKYLVLLLVAAAFQAGDALECYSCNASTPETCGVAADNLQGSIITCNNNDTCYSTLNGDSGKIEYGCKDPKTCFDDLDCVNCTYNKCNIKAYKPLTCFTCDSTNPFCGYNFQEDKVPQAKDCGGSYGRGACYTRMSSGNVKRGCSSSADPCGSSSECETCHSNKCNGKDKSQEVNCFECDGITDECSGEEVKKAAKNMTVTCSNLFKEPLCYKWTRYGIAYRGCTAKKSTQRCRISGLDSCDLCDTNECNSSSQLGVSFIIYLVAPIIASIYRY